MLLVHYHITQNVHYRIDYCYSHCILSLHIVYCHFTLYTITNTQDTSQALGLDASDEQRALLSLQHKYAGGYISDERMYVVCVCVCVCVC